MKDGISPNEYVCAKHSENQKVNISKEVVAGRRKQFPEACMLSDYQVESAHVTALAITSVADGSQTGPVYVPMPTGSGKTTGAIWGIVDVARKNPDRKICFLTPYVEAVERVHAALVSHLGGTQVGFYHSKAGANKNAELSKPVVVLTHEFIKHNKDLLDDFELFVVDEAIYDTGQAVLSLADLGRAYTWSTANQVMVAEFGELRRLINATVDQFEGKNATFQVIPKLGSRRWVQELAENFDPLEHAKSAEELEFLKGVTTFCKAMLSGQAFAFKRQTTGGGHEVDFVAAIFGIPRMDKTVVLTATGGAIYGSTGSFKQDEISKQYWTRPSYEAVELIHLIGPKFTGNYRSWSASGIGDRVVSYVDWVLEQVPEKRIYLTLPKQVVEGCLRAYLGQQQHEDLTYPIKVQKHGKTIFISHHDLSIGSNDFADCGAVVYLWPNYKPQSVTVQRTHVLKGTPITEKALEEANGTKLLGVYARVRDAMTLENIIQQIGRGNIRNIKEGGVAGKMKAYVHVSGTIFQRLACSYSGCHRSELKYELEGECAKLSRHARVLKYLSSVDASKYEVTATDIRQELGFDLKRVQNDWVDDWELGSLGWKYVAGRRGRGCKARFVRA